jgi:integrase/recombinase XerD
MKLDKLVEKYIAFKRAKGMRFHSQSQTLRFFARRLGSLDITQVKSEAVVAFLYDSKKVTTTWHQKHSTLNGLYRYAITRGYVQSSPLPALLPKKAQYAPPYIYSTKEIKDLLDSAAILNDNIHRLGDLSVTTFRTLLLVLYGAGLRLREALSLTMSDIDLTASVLTIRNTKFFKTRLVPIGAKLTAVLQDYLNVRQKAHGRPKIDEVIFLNYRGTPLAGNTAERYFGFVRSQAGVQRNDGAYFQPRLHDLRSSFAVHRLVTWYRQGADVQKMLPLLSTYLGHVNVADTQVYLRMTPELLIEANRRFEQYAHKEVNNA